MIVEKLGVPYEEAKALLLKHGSIRQAIDSYDSNS